MASSTSSSRMASSTSSSSTSSRMASQLQDKVTDKPIPVKNGTLTLSIDTYYKHFLNHPQPSAPNQSNAGVQLIRFAAPVNQIPSKKASTLSKRILPKPQAGNVVSPVKVDHESKGGSPGVASTVKLPETANKCGPSSRTNEEAVEDLLGPVSEGLQTFVSKSKYLAQRVDALEEENKMLKRLQELEEKHTLQQKDDVSKETDRRMSELSATIDKLTIQCDDLKGTVKKMKDEVDAYKNLTKELREKAKKYLKQRDTLKAVIKEDVQFSNKRTLSVKQIFAATFGTSAIPCEANSIDTCDPDLEDPSSSLPSSPDFPWNDTDRETASQESDCSYKSLKIDEDKTDDVNLKRRATDTESQLLKKVRAKADPPADPRRVKLTDPRKNALLTAPQAIDTTRDPKALNVSSKPASTVIGNSEEPTKEISEIKQKQAVKFIIDEGTREAKMGHKSDEQMAKGSGVKEGQSGHIIDLTDDHTFSDHEDDEDNYCLRNETDKDVAERKLLIDWDPNNKERNSRKRGPVTCDICSKQLSTNHALQTHIRIQHEKKLLRCLFGACEKKFRYQRDLKSHWLKDHGAILPGTRVNPVIVEPVTI